MADLPLTKMLMEKKQWKKTASTYSRVEREDYEKPKSYFKNLTRYLPNDGEHLFAISTEVKIRCKGFKGQRRDLDQALGTFPPSVLQCVMERAWNALLVSTDNILLQKL